MEGKTNFSRRLKQFDGLTWLTPTPAAYFTTDLRHCVWPVEMSHCGKTRSLPRDVDLWLVDHRSQTTLFSHAVVSSCRLQLTPALLKTFSSLQIDFKCSCCCPVPPWSRPVHCSACMAMLSSFCLSTFTGQFHIPLFSFQLTQYWLLVSCYRASECTARYCFTKSVRPSGVLASEGWWEARQPSPKVTGSY